MTAPGSGAGEAIPFQPHRQAQQPRNKLRQRLVRLRRQQAQLAMEGFIHGHVEAGSLLWSLLAHLLKHNVPRLLRIRYPLKILRLL
jgi:hypothetical protein